MKRNIGGLAGALLLVAMAWAASAAPYDGPRDRPNNDGADGVGLPGLPGGRGGRGGQPEGASPARPGGQSEVRLKRYCGDLLRRRPGRLDPNFRPRDCEDWFAQLDRSYPPQQAPRDGGGHGAREGADGPSVAGGQGGPGGAPGRGPGGADGGNGGAGVAGGTGGAGGKGGDGY